MGGNQTQNNFILLGITDSRELRILLFGPFLLIYIITLVGNVGLVALVWASPSLHTPMYFFLAHFSFADACYSTVISPRMLLGLLWEDQTISWAGCVLQFHLFAFLVTAECHLLAATAYDRHVAVCHPLLYVTLVSGRLCWRLVASSYLLAFLSALVYTRCIFGGPFCGPNRLDHFFCDAGPVLRLCCADTRRRRALIVALVALNGLSTGGMVLLSYARILRTVLAVKSSGSGARAFGTCGSHLAAVAVFYGTILFTYLQPAANRGSPGKVASVLYTLVTPMLNPFIYSLRNKEVKGALGRWRRRILNRGPQRAPAAWT